MGVMRDMEIVWDDLLDAFENPDPEMIYFLDRQTGEVFYVPADYEDDAFWDEIDADQERYLAIPYFDYDQERLLLHEFIKGVANEKLKTVLNRTFIGKSPYGRLDEILSFYPEELERLASIKEQLLATRVGQWLEEHDIYPSAEPL
ncbi:UPF0158 family protein [Geotalea toluenoxydans]|uniref:UPF0158 family protein n=1 Tax=Geotalea toluenoxydans TaxID=421624 RepID=UPI0006D20989|nr:UPF0158 family protein [Geotalea toluenoxydans]